MYVYVCIVYVYSMYVYCMANTECPSATNNPYACTQKFIVLSEIGCGRLFAPQ